MLKRKRRVRPILYVGVMALGVWGAEGEEADSGAMWDYTFTLRGAIGYKDNVLLSNVQTEKSAFWQTGADFMAFRLGEGGSSLNFSLSGSDRRYFSSRSVNKEQDASMLFSWNQPFKQDFETGVELSYFYLDQVVDASVDEFLVRRLQVKTHVLSGEPFLQYNLPNDWFVRLAAQVERNYVDVLDDYTETGPQLQGGKNYGHRSKAYLSYSYHLRFYDTREQIRLDYTPERGTDLVYDQHEVEARVNHNWDEDRKWRSRVRASYERNEDNGFGFFDYDKVRFGKSFAYHGTSWNVSVEGKVLHYNYDHQTVAGPGSEKWERWNYILGVRAEKNILPRLKVFVESEHEWSKSNDPFSEYEVNTVFSGVDWEF